MFTFLALLRTNRECIFSLRFRSQIERVLFNSSSLQLGNRFRSRRKASGCDEMDLVSVGFGFFQKFHNLHIGCRASIVKDQSIVNVKDVVQGTFMLLIFSLLLDSLDGGPYSLKFFNRLQHTSLHFICSHISRIPLVEKEFSFGKISNKIFLSPMMTLETVAQSFLGAMFVWTLSACFVCCRSVRNVSPD